MWHADFCERNAEDDALSFEDKKFLDIMSNSVKQVDGKYELPMPFKEDTTPTMPESRRQAFTRLQSIKKRLQSDSQFCKDYCGFMDKLLQKGYARQCHDSEGAWYIPHHVYWNTDVSPSIPIYPFTPSK